MNVCARIAPCLVPRSSVAAAGWARGNDTVPVESGVLPDVTIGRGCRLRLAVIDQGCVVPAGTVNGERLAADTRRFYVSDGGVTRVTTEMLAALPALALLSS